MNKLLIKKPLWLALGGLTAITLPIAITVACGESSTPITPVVSPAEQKAQADISGAPQTKPTSGNPLLFDIRAAVSVKADAAKQPIAVYLASKTPTEFQDDFGALGLILTNQIANTWKLPASANFDSVTLLQIIGNLGVSSSNLVLQVAPYFQNYDGNGANAFSSWANFLGLWNYAFNPANNYANIQSLLTRLGLTQKNFTDFDKVLSSPAGQPSGIVTPTGDPIAGLGGTSIIPVTAPVVSAEEQAARAAIINPPAGDTLLVQLNTDLAAVAASRQPALTLTAYLNSVTPNTLDISVYANVLINLVRTAWQIPAATTLDFATFVRLFTDLDVTIASLSASVPQRANELAGANASLWGGFTKVLRDISAASNNYIALQNFFTQGASPVITPAKLGQLNTILSAPAGQPSGIKTTGSTPTDINGFGGVSLITPQDNTAQ